MWGKGPGFDPRSRNCPFFLMFACRILYVASLDVHHASSLSTIGPSSIQIQHVMHVPYGGPSGASPTGSGMHWTLHVLGLDQIQLHTSKTASNPRPIEFHYFTLFQLFYFLNSFLILIIKPTKSQKKTDLGFFIIKVNFCKLI